MNASVLDFRRVAGTTFCLRAKLPTNCYPATPIRVLGERKIVRLPCRRKGWQHLYKYHLKAGWSSSAKGVLAGSSAAVGQSFGGIGSVCAQ